MPGTARAPNKPPRAKSRKKPDIIMRHIKAMHLPMLEARALIEALSLVGRGMNELGRDEGDAVMSVAQAAAERIEAVREVWSDFIQALRE
jgi:hypothetical protein